jgi:hypothetical protein
MNHASQVKTLWREMLFSAGWMEEDGWYYPHLMMMRFGR